MGRWTSLSDYDYLEDMGSLGPHHRYRHDELPRKVLCACGRSATVTVAQFNLGANAECDTCRLKRVIDQAKSPSTLTPEEDRQVRA